MRAPASLKARSPLRLPPESGAERPPSQTASDAAAAAVAIQAGARGYLTRRELRPERARRHKAATALQAAVRAKRSRRRLAAAVKLQSAFRGWRCREVYHDMLDQIVASEQIQAAFRGWQVRSALLAEAEALVAEQSVHEDDTTRRPEGLISRSQPQPDAEGQLQAALERVRQGLLARGPEDVADALAAMTVLATRLAELSLQYDRPI